VKSGNETKTGLTTCSQRSGQGNRKTYTNLARSAGYVILRRSFVTVYHNKNAVVIMESC